MQQTHYDHVHDNARMVRMIAGKLFSGSGRVDLDRVAHWSKEHPSRAAMRLS
jgi:hypothetical protein